MNLGEARGALAARGFDYLAAPNMDLMLNRARNDFEDHWPWPWLSVKATGTSPLDLADLKYVQQVSDARGNGLWGLDRAQATDTAATAGPPTHWYLEDAPSEHVLVRTLPDGGQITVLYIRQTPELAGPNDTPLIPARYHAVWIDWAVVQAYKDSDNFSAAQALQADINGRMQMLVERYETRNRMHSTFIAAHDFSEDG